ncbi:MAG TPA: S9 family peptidase [Bryobacteraceae bacterium]|nr:S9 family peptidase [Bryobacteraceae bacterium]
MRPYIFCTVLFASRLLLTGAPASVDTQLESLDAQHEFREVELSPDHHQVAWIESAPSKIAGELPVLSVYVKDLRESTPAKRVGDSTVRIQGLTWSRDGRLAFVSDSESHGQMELYVVEKPGHSKPRKLGSLQGYVGDPKWSPDGKSIALLLIDGVTRVPGPTEATAPESGVIASNPVEQRLAIVNVATGASRSISPADMYVYEFDWSPDSKDLAYLAAPGDGDNNWYVAEIYAIDAASGAVRHVLKPSGQVANVRWSPEGNSIAYIGGLMSDEGVVGGEIYALPAQGGEPRDLTPDRKSSPTWFEWSASSKQILFGENIAGDSAISTLDVASLSTETLWKGAETGLFSGDASTSAVVRSSYSMAPEIWAGPTGKWEQVTHSNAAQQRAWGEVKNLHWKNGGFDVQGWLMFPEPYDPSKRYPMLVEVHGGPASVVRSRWPRGELPLELMSSQGYFIFMPNPRGSYGQGEQFTRANVKDFGHGDLEDILGGVDDIVKNYPVDSKRIGIGGWSYGGFMTMWTVTQTHRFRAAFAGAGIANWQSYYGENGIDQWMIPYFGASVYDDPAVYAKSSPINFIKNVQTPTLVIVGDRDAECPPAQSYEFWHALKTLGVKTEFVLYPGEGHGFHDPQHIRDRFDHVIKWFAENMPAE